MSNFLKYLSFRIILIIITLHAVVPHPHSDELSTDKHFEIHQKSNSFIGIIRLVFHENNDENLDNLYSNQYADLGEIHVKDHNPEIFRLHDLTLNVKKNGRGYNPSDAINDVSKSTLFVRQNGLRGPPSLV